MPSFQQQPIDHIIDVRSKLEFWLGHVPGAVCMPVDGIHETLPARTEIARNARILVYCASGGRSAAARETLQRLGYTRVVNGGAMTNVTANLSS
ncbi:MAG: rhodanese-like domain-containing protein [Gemmatimonadetes bacterium]|nr:rhodanese-like domain-containing protein [Gemmatimonadota bacterium]